MVYEPPFNRTPRIDSLCMEIAELVGMLTPNGSLMTSPILHRKLHIKTIHSSLLIEGNTLDERAVTAELVGYGTRCFSPNGGPSLRGSLLRVPYEAGSQT